MSDLKELTEVLKKLEVAPNPNDRNLPLLRKALELIEKLLQPAKKEKK